MAESALDLQLLPIENTVISSEIQIPPELKLVDICYGADPFLFKRDDMWHLLLQEDLRVGVYDHDGIKGCTIRSSETIDGLSKAESIPVSVIPQNESLHQSWAPEIFGDYMYIAHSNGDNRTHRMHVYRNNDNTNQWIGQGRIKSPEKDDSWAIDMTFVEIPTGGKNEKYAVWSGWENPDDEFPQNIYIAQAISPTEIGERYVLAKADKEWSTSVKPLLEGPQALIIDDTFRGLLVSGNASWTQQYATGVIKYTGGDPLRSSSWIVGENTLFQKDFGIGHGMIVNDDGKLVFIGHRKTNLYPGWADRKVFYTQIGKETLENHLESIQ